MTNKKKFSAWELGHMRLAFEWSVVHSKVSMLEVPKGKVVIEPSRVLKLKVEQNN